MSATLTDRRGKLTRQLEKLTGRRDKAAAELESVTRAWESALEAGTDTGRHAGKRRALTASLEDLNAEIARVRGWIADADAQDAAAERRAQMERDFAAASARYAADVARFAELRMYASHWREIAAQVLRFAEDATARAREAAQLEAEFPGRREHVRALADELGAAWSPPAIPGPPEGGPAAPLPISRAMFAAGRGDVDEVARQLGGAAMYERGTKPH